MKTILSENTSSTRKTQAMFITWQQSTLWDLSLWDFEIQTDKLLGCLNIWCYRQMLQEEIFILCSWCSSTDPTHLFSSWAVCLHRIWRSQRLVEKVTSTVHMQTQLSPIDFPRNWIRNNRQPSLSIPSSPYESIVQVVIFSLILFFLFI